MLFNNTHKTRVKHENFSHKTPKIKYLLLYRFDAEENIELQLMYVTKN